MRIPQTETEFINALVDAAELGGQKALQEAGLLKDTMSMAAARKKYGPFYVRRWLQEGIVDKIQDRPNGNIRLSRIQLEAAAKAGRRT